VPHDLGYAGPRATVDAASVEAILSHSISDLEIEAVVEGLDASRVVMIIDACNSGQALEAEERRRGPMNSKGLAQLAYGYANQLAEALEYVGVFALELFCLDGVLLANEMAPRVHNSGHWTIEGADTSQFQNHLRAVLGLPLGDTGPLGHACMLNWIGSMPDADAVLREPGGHWHDYGKQPREGRKVGHATLRADDATALACALRNVGVALGREEQVAPVLRALGAAQG
jgi:formate-dependent phosphoribosylglycinamide formyltransferase (GAR transformylase)